MYKAGQELHGFTIERVFDLKEFRSTGIVARHLKSGARVFHTLNDDEENLFAFIFKTMAENSNGVAHILEHSVLCGSESFPVKDPFVQLLKGSMQTFLNAFTFPDKTVYPAASTVEEDVFNLMEVYADAVFFPKLREDLFRQEGHRLEIDEDGKLLRTGIVYNEMKGNYSTHDSVAGDWSYRALFPDTIYRFDSGGDPAEIPQLSYEAFKEFHARYYHPSNALIYLYGNIATETYLEFLDRRFLSRFRVQDPPAAVDLQPRWTEARRLEQSYPSGEEDKEETHSSVTINWLLHPVEDRVRTLSWEILTEVLMGSPASPLQKAAAQSDLGEDLSSTSGYETELRQTVFSVGLQGTDRRKVNEVEALFLDELAKQVEQGLNKELVEGAIRHFEFSSREIKGGGPFGLRLMRRLARGWLHGLEPEHSLEFVPVLEQIRKELEANPCYFEDLIKEDLLDNPHRASVVVYPDAHQNQREAEAEAKELEDLLNRYQGSERELFLSRLKEEQESLARFQSEPDPEEALASIPSLDLSQIPQEVDKIPTRQGVLTLGKLSFPLYSLEQYTNGIAYFHTIIDYSGLSEEEEMLLSLWTSFVPIAGTKDKAYEELSRELGLVSGGFSASVEASASLDLLSGAHSLSSDYPASPLTRGAVHRFLFFRLKALGRDVPASFDLSSRLIREADFNDLDHLAEVFFELRNDIRSSILPGGSAYARLRALLGLHPVQDLEERLRGLTQYLFLEDLAERIQSDKKEGKKTTLEALSQALAGISNKLLQPERISFSLSSEEDILVAAEQELARVAEILVSAAGSPEEEKGSNEIAGIAAAASAKLPLALPLNRLEVLEYPSKVAFTAAAVPASVLGTPEQAAESLLAHVLRTGALWEEIRMKGGAYGASAASDGMAGIFSFSSYRDPRTLESLEAYRTALSKMAEQALDSTALDQAKIGALSRELRPLSPSEKAAIGLRRILYKVEDRLRQRRRELTLGLSAQDLCESAAMLNRQMEKARKAILCGPEMAEPLKKEKVNGESPVHHSLGR